MVCLLQLYSTFFRSTLLPDDVFTLACRPGGLGVIQITVTQMILGSLPGHS